MYTLDGVPLLYLFRLCDISLATAVIKWVDQNVPRVSPGGEKIIFAMGDEAGDATWDDVDHLKEFRLYLPTYNNDHELTFY